MVASDVASTGILLDSQLVKGAVCLIAVYLQGPTADEHLRTCSALVRMRLIVMRFERDDVRELASTQIAFDCVVVAAATITARCCSFSADRLLIVTLGDLHLEHISTEGYQVA